MIEKFRILPVLAAIALSGCATAPTPKMADDTSMLAPHVPFVIPPPQALDENVGVAQQVVAHFRQQSFTFQTQIQITPDELDLAAIDGMGRRALTVTWKPNGLDSQKASWLPPELRPADILAAIAVVYWPEKAVVSALSPSGATLTETGGTRRISAGGRDLIVVKYGDGEGWNRSAALSNLAFGYDIEIQSAELSP